MDDLSTIEALTRTERHLELLTGVRPEVLVADLHPDYRSTGWARAHAAGRPVRLVQHHHAHVASVMAEHGMGAGRAGHRGRVRRHRIRHRTARCGAARC